MFKDVFKLKKTAYHVKIMRYIWNLDHSDFSHMCPYWWLSVLNHLLIVELFIIKESFRYTGRLLTWLWKKGEDALEAIDDYMEAKRLEALQKQALYYEQHPDEFFKVRDKDRNKILNATNYKIRSFLRDKYNEFENMLEQSKIMQEAEAQTVKLKDKFLKVCTIPDKQKLLENDQWIAYMDQMEQQELQRKMQREREAREAKRQRKIRNKNKINAILRIAKPILTWCAYIFGSGAFVVALYFIVVFVYKSIHYLGNVDHSTYVMIGHGLGKIGIGILALAFLAALGLLLYKVIGKIRLPKISFGISLPKSMKKKRPNRITPILNKITQPFVWFAVKVLYAAWKRLCGGVALAIQMFKNECPPIEWED